MALARIPSRRPGPGRSHSGRVLRGCVLAFGCVALLSACSTHPGAGSALDWSASSQVTTRTYAAQNRGLDADSKDMTYATGLDTGLSVRGTGKRTSLSANLGINSEYFVGEDEDVAGTGRIDPSLGLSISHRGQGMQLSFDSSVRVTAQDDSQTDNADNTSGSPTRIDGNAQVSLQKTLSEINSAGFSVGTTIVEFADAANSNVVPTRGFFGNVNWRHEVDALNTLSFSAGLRDFSADNTENTNSQTLDVTVALDHIQTDRHRFDLTLGSSAVRSTDDFSDGPDFNVGFNGGVGFNYNAKRTNAGLSLRQSVDPSSEGDLQSFTRLSGNIGYQLTSDQSIAGSVTYIFRSSFDGDTEDSQAVTISPSYRHRIARATSVSLSYQYRLISDDDFADGHRVTVALTRDFNLLKGP